MRPAGGGSGRRRSRQVKIDDLKRDRDQLFAEAVVAFKAGEQWWPTAEFEEKHASVEQAKRYRDRRLGGADRSVS